MSEIPLGAPRSAYGTPPSRTASLTYESVTIYPSGWGREDFLRALPPDHLGHRWYEHGTTDGGFFDLREPKVFVTQCYLCHLVRVEKVQDNDGRHYFTPNREPALLTRCPNAVKTPRRRWWRR